MRQHQANKQSTAPEQGHNMATERCSKGKPWEANGNTQSSSPCSCPAWKIPGHLWKLESKFIFIHHPGEWQSKEVKPFLLAYGNHCRDPLWWALSHSANSHPFKHVSWLIFLELQNLESYVQNIDISFRKRTELAFTVSSETFKAQSIYNLRISKKPTFYKTPIFYILKPYYLMFE